LFKSKIIVLGAGEAGLQIANRLKPIDINFKRIKIKNIWLQLLFLKN